MKGYMAILLSRYITDSDESVIGSRQFTGAVRAARSIVSDRLAAEGAQARIRNGCRFWHQTVGCLMTIKIAKAIIKNSRIVLRKEP